MVDPRFPYCILENCSVMAGAVSESELLMQCTEISDTGMHDSVMLLLTFVVYEVYHCAPPQRPHLTRCNIFDRYVCTSPCLGPKR